MCDIIIRESKNMEIIKGVINRGVIKWILKLV